MMRRGFQSTSVRPYTAGSALAGAALLALALVIPSPVPAVPVPHAAAPAIQLTSVAAADLSSAAVEVSAALAEVVTSPSPATAAPAPVVASRSAAASPTAADTPDLLAFAASILEYLNSLGLGAGPGLAAIGLTGLAVAFAATAYAWNGFADLVNPTLRFFNIPRVPKFPVCFAGDPSCGSSAAAQARVVNPDHPATTTPGAPANRGVASSKRAAERPAATIDRQGLKAIPAAVSIRTARKTATPTSTKVRGTKKSTPSSSGVGGSKRDRGTADH
ncbi:hypothetical protein ORI20_14545 [Mycobacterium sp. CVI_P3]|uniref:Uncharacterized protein n=1 Tax=Mycobacterium pinniadriaticum TaxID=2994102 RepID=A0ABT3SEI0_9MYCO|nr:hypothetical protein [Mycobacterium pinniadriaticum]MCX2931499.1 hypothetical protein [Mycobacterium pinniadriaticum]MCX2937923.1 hypothetical protein [Mycobacterium pinniadriaticum]